MATTMFAEALDNSQFSYAAHSREPKLQQSFLLMKMKKSIHRYRLTD
jgi:hypothetical protein